MVKRPEIASQRNWQILDTEISFPRNSIIVQWQVWANEPGTVRLQVYRAVAREGRAARMKHPYRLVGENVVTLKEKGFCPIDIVDRDQVQVQKGDVIGMRIDSDLHLLEGGWPHRLQAGDRVDKNGTAVTPSGVIAFDYHSSDNPTDPDAKHGGHLCRYCTHEYLGIDEILDFNDDGARNHVGLTIFCYRLLSIAAVVVPAADQTPMPQVEVEDDDKEAGLLYLINDPVLAPGPKAVLADLREERLLEANNPAGLATTGRLRKGAAKKGAKPTNNTTPAKLAGHASPGKGASSSPTRKADARATDASASAKGSSRKMEVGEGAKAALAKPVLDGRRLPEGERLPKELEMRERELRDGTGPYPAPVAHELAAGHDVDGEDGTP